MIPVQDVERLVAWLEQRRDESLDEASRKNGSDYVLFVDRAGTFAEVLGYVQAIFSDTSEVAS